METKYKLKVLVGTPGDMEENIDWNKYKNSKSELVEMEFTVKDSWLDDKLPKGNKPLESFRMDILDVRNGK